MQNPEAHTALVDAERTTDPAEDALRPRRASSISMPDASGILREASRVPQQGDLIGKLASNRYSVGANTEIYALAAAMDKSATTLAVGVVDEQGVPLGLISRQHLFDHLGKLYGRDLYKRKQVSELLQPARAFRDDLNVFVASEQLRDDLQRMDDTWYVLVDAKGRFSGVFSSKNLLIYLSETTARDLALARRLQSAIVREGLCLERPRFALACYSKMAKEVGGDFYLVKELDEKRVLLALCDVSGKGIAASLVTAVLGGIFDTYSAHTSLKVFLRRLSRYLYETFRLDYFVTGIFMEFNLERGEATICDMGHSYLLLVRGKKLLRAGSRALNPPLGVAPDTMPVLSGFRLGSGDLVLLFTDGLVDQRNACGAEYSENRLWRLLRTHADLPVQQIRDRISSDCERFREGEPQGDDLTFMMLRFGGPGAPVAPPPAKTTDS